MHYFGETRTDCIMFRASWADWLHGIGLHKYDLTWKEHEDAVGCGRAIMFFEARIRPMGGVEGQIHRLVFVEEYWPLPSDIWKGGARANRDILSSEFGCRRLYRGSPAKIYAVMKVEYST